MLFTAAAASGAWNCSASTAPPGSMAFSSKRTPPPSLVIRQVGVLAAAARLAVLAVGDDVEVAFLPGHAVQVGLAPRIERHVLAEIGPGPLRLARRPVDQRLQPELAARIVAGIETVGIERLGKRVDLRFRDADFRLADLREIARRDEARQQADDHYDDEQLDQ